MFQSSGAGGALLCLRLQNQHFISAYSDGNHISVLAEVVSDAVGVDIEVDILVKSCVRVRPLFSDLRLRASAALFRRKT
jgi:hypothetical protein